MGKYFICALFLAPFLGCFFFTSPFVFYFADKDIETNCRVMGRKIAITECENLHNCRYIEKFENTTGKYYLCVCYAEYLDLFYHAFETPTESSAELRNEILNTDQALIDLENNYPDGTMIKCYFDKFNTSDIHLEYNAQWQDFLAIDLVSCAGVSILILTIYLMHRQWKPIKIEKELSQI
jgi:hypothetical protein